MTQNKDPVLNPREKIIFKAIANNPNIHYNALKRLVVEKGKHMAKATFDKLAKGMVERKIVSHIKDGNKIRYFIMEMTNLDDYESFSLKYLELIERQLRMMEKKYAKLPLLDKIIHAVSISQGLLSSLNYYDLFAKLKPHPPFKYDKEIKDRYDKMLSKLLAITSTDSNSSIVNYYVMISTLHVVPLRGAELARWLKAKEEELKKRLGE